MKTGTKRVVALVSMVVVGVGTLGFGQIDSLLSFSLWGVGVVKIAAVGVLVSAWWLFENAI